MHGTASLVRSLSRSRALVLAAGVALAAVPAAAAPYEVVLADGTTIAASNKPAIALGKVSFVDATRRPVTLPVSRVDVAATRARCQGGPTARVWTQASLAQVTGRVQVLGESEAAPPEDGGDGAAAGAAAEASGEPELANMSHADRLRFEIGQLDRLMKPLSAKDHKRTVYVTKQRELQLELDRILNG